MSSLNISCDTFGLLFLGRFVGDRVNTMKQMAQVKFAEIMGIEITRLQHFRVDIDYADVYIHATLLDRLPAARMDLFSM